MKQEKTSLLKRRLTFIACTCVIFMGFSSAARATDFIPINTVAELTSIGISSDMPLNGNYKLVLQNFGSETYSEFETLDLGPILNPTTDGVTRYVSAYVGGPVYNNGSFNGDVKVFNGIFDGNGKTLTGLNRPLFWGVEGSAGSLASIYNLTLQTQGVNLTRNETGLESTFGEQPQFPRGVLANDIKYASVSDVEVSGSINAKLFGPGGAFVCLEKVGGLAGSAENANFNNVTSNVEIKISSGTQIEGFDFDNAANSVGGLIGDASNVNIQNSVSMGDVRGTRSVGGLVGALGNSIITNSSASGNVIAQSAIRQIYPDTAIGGLIGTGMWSQITNSSASGDVSGNDLVGGLIGLSAHNVISDARVTGRIIQGETRVGGLLGISSYDTILTSSSTSEIRGRDEVGGFVGRFTLGDIRDSYILNKTSDNLFGKISESNVDNSYSFWLGNPDSWSAFLKFADQIVSSKSYLDLLIKKSEQVEISTLTGQALKISFDFTSEDKLHLWLKTPNGEKVYLGELEVIDGKILLPPIEFSQFGDYKLELIGFDPEKVVSEESVASIDIAVSE